MRLDTSSPGYISLTSAYLIILQEKNRYRELSMLLIIFKKHYISKFNALTRRRLSFASNFDMTILVDFLAMSRSPWRAGITLETIASDTPTHSHPPLQPCEYRSQASVIPLLYTSSAAHMKCVLSMRGSSHSYLLLPSKRSKTAVGESIRFPTMFKTKSPRNTAVVVTVSCCLRRALNDRACGKMFRTSHHQWIGK